MAFRERRLRQLLEAADRGNERHRFFADFEEAIKKGEIKPGDYRIGPLFEELVPDGRELIRTWKDQRRGGFLMEAAGAVTSSDFANITGQVVYSSVLDTWNSPEFLADKLTTTVPTDILTEEIIAGVAAIGDDMALVPEATDYPIAGPSEDWVHTPPKEKWGVICPITKEAVISDKTGQLLQQAADIGRGLRISKEKRVLDICLVGTSAYRRKNQAAENVYNDAASHGESFDNLSDQNLADYTDIDAAMQLFQAMSEPATGEPVVITAVDLVVPLVLRATAWRILNATQVGNTASASAPVGPNPIGPLHGNFTLHSTAYVYARTGSATQWFIGDFKRAFVYMEVWPITVEQAPANSDAAFERDIVTQYKISEMGVCGVKEPRYVVKSTA